MPRSARRCASCCAAPSRQGKLKPRDPASPEEGSGYIVLAMGKMGAFELNYSSDIDLIVLYDADAPALADGVERGAVLRPPHARPGQAAAGAHRRRLRVPHRPAAAARSGLDRRSRSRLAAALNYYESIGQNWERAAMIKARPCAGDIAAGEAFLKELAPFIWRKYLDYAAVADVHAMKRQIHAYKGHDEIAVEGHNIKLGRGGIREIEFFVQTQQLIAGGRHPELRGRADAGDARRISPKGGWIRPRAARRPRARPIAFCAASSTACRWSPTSRPIRCRPIAEELERFARFLGYANRDAFAAVLLEHLRKVQRHYAQLFEDAPAAEASRRRARLSPENDDDRETLDQLAAMGFRRPLEASPGRAALACRRIPLAQERICARRICAELVPVLLDHLARSENPDAGAGRARPLPRRAARRRAAACRCCGRIRISSRCSRSCSAPRRGLPTFWRCIRK